MAAFEIEDFDENNPQAFYIVEQQQEIEGMADACLVVEGTRLPVHTQVLSLASGVLCHLFTRLKSEPAGDESSSQARKRKAEGSVQVSSGRVDSVSDN